MDHSIQHEQLRQLLSYEPGLEQYFDVLVNSLKVHSTNQLKYVHKEDLTDVGIPKLDAQRLIKLCQKTRHGTSLNKFKKKLAKNAPDDVESVSASSTPTGKPLMRSKLKSSSMREGHARGLHVGMISAPQNDFRHTLHVGCDGAVFGDASFLGGGELVSSHSPTMNRQSSNCASSLSLPLCTDRLRQTALGSQSDVSLISVGSMSCVASIVSSDTLTDVSSLQDIDDDDLKSVLTAADYDHENEFCDDDRLGDLTIPDFSDLDLGKSLVDEVLQALGGSSNRPRTESNSPPRPNGTTAADKRSPENAKCDIENTRLVSSSSSSSSPPPINNSSNCFVSNGTGSNGRERVETVPPPASSLQTSMNILEKKFNKECTVVDSRNSSVLVLQPDIDERIVYESDSPSQSPNVHSKKKGRKTGRRSSPATATTANVWRNQRDSSTEDQQRHTALSSDHLAVSCEPRLRGDLSKPKRAHSKGERSAHRSLDNELQAQSSTSSNVPLASFSSSADLLLGRDSTAAGRFASSSSSSLPLKSGLDGHKSKPSRPSSFVTTATAKMPAVEITSEASSSDTGLLRSFGKAALSRFSGLRSSMSSRGSSNKDDLPTLPPTNLNVNTLFFDRLREQELENARRADIDQDANDSGNSSNFLAGSDDQGSNEVLPSASQPTDRQWTLEASGVSDFPEKSSFQNNQSTVLNADPSSGDVQPSLIDGYSCQIPKIEVTILSSQSVESHDSSSHESVHSNATQPSDEGVYSDDSVAVTCDQDSTAAVVDDQVRQQPSSHPRLLSSSFNTAAMSISAEKLGRNDRYDNYWTRKVDFQSRLSGARKGHEMGPTDMRSGGILNGFLWYDDEEHVSNGYLDGESNNSQANDEILLITAFISDVTQEDCMYALSETEWDVNSAIKLLLLRQLIGLSGADAMHCKRALLMCDWHLELAADYLTAHPPGQDSPEIVHV